MSELRQGSSLRRPRLARKLSRRLSLVTNLIGTKLKQEFGSATDLSYRPSKSSNKSSLQIPVIAPDKTQTFIHGDESRTIKDALKLLVAEYSVQEPRLLIAGSYLEVDSDAPLGLLQGEVLIVEDAVYTPSPKALRDTLLRATEEWLLDEVQYGRALRAGPELYGLPLLRAGCLTSLQVADVFMPLQALASTITSLTNKMKIILEDWENSKDKIGEIFDEALWDCYASFQDSYRTAKGFLRNKSKEDEDFEELCRIRRGAAILTLKDIFELPVCRLAQYEQYFDTLFQEANIGHEHLHFTVSQAKQALKRGQVESDLERIQDLFPSDCLKLYDKDAITMRMKGLMRKGRGGRLTRALSAKSLRPESPPRQQQVPPPPPHRQFIMEAPVNFTQGMQVQERHLFLFTDLLLVAKARSGSNFKLKETVRVSEIWTSSVDLDLVSSIVKSPDTSFLIGWPTTNLVVTFSTQAARDLWWNKLSEVVNVEKAKEPRSTNIQVTYVDATNSIEYCKTFAVRAEDTARGCVKLAVSGLEGGGGGDPGGGGWRLWAKTPRDDSPVPLIGHERPFAIKLSCLRDSLSAEEGFDLDHCNNVHDPLAKCHFILRNSYKENGSDSVDKKNGKKASSRIKLGQVFRRTPNKDEPTGFLFGLPLSKLCNGDKLPSPLICMLSQVNGKGPFTQGIFRRSANARLVRELREKLDRGENVAWDQVPVLATAALLKDLLRSLPDPLLSSSLHPHWAAAMEINNLHQRLAALKGVYEKLPKVNQWLLCQFISVLSSVARRCQDNLMSAANLAVCVGPSLLWSDCPAQDLRLVPSLVETLIHHAPAIMSPPHIPSFDTRDSGTDESDSMKRDDSSIESLECSPPPRKDKISLSRDSGLTMSDSQLYTPDEEESGSTSSSGYDPAFDPHSKVTPSISVPGEYVRVYGGWEERMNPNFQRQAWFRQRYAAAGRAQAVTCTKPEVAPRHPPPRRSASEESLLDPPPPTPPRRNKPDLRNKSNLHVYSLRSELRSMAPVTCEVISESRRQQYRESVYSNTPKPAVFQSQQSTSSPQENSIYYTPKYSPRLEFTQSLLDTSSDSSLYKTCVENQSKEEDSSTLSDDDCTPHVSRSNSRGNEVKAAFRPHEVKSSLRHVSHEIKTSLRHLPPVHVESAYIRPSRPRNPRDSPRLATRSRSLPPPPASVAKRAPITTYYLGDTPYHVTTSYRDEESYV